MAAFLNCVLQDEPNLCVAYAASLWTGDHFTFRSEQGGIDVRPTRGTIAALGTIQRSTRQAARISDLDWMAMAGLSGTTHGHNRTADAGDGWLS